MHTPVAPSIPVARARYHRGSAQNTAVTTWAFGTTEVLGAAMGIQVERTAIPIPQSLS